jgi:alkanesulfonate monooxygenase SsuD/methylene tetrahydromethanopterin reductase-like flavin-dependent oxidoreductase (luciferase family)
MTSYSVLVPFLPRRPEQVLPYAAFVDWTGADRLWQGQAVLVEPFQGFTSAAGAGFRVPTGIGVTLMPLQHPYEAAHRFRSLAMTTGRSVVAGIGPGARSFQRSLLGRPYAEPLTAVREYVTMMRGLLAGEHVSTEGTYFGCDAAMLPAVSPPIELGLGVLRRGMARLAGEVADVAITWLTPARYLRDEVVPALREGAMAAGRAEPRLAALVPVALARPDRDPVGVVLASNAAHMSAPHYIDMLRRAGIELGDDPALAAKRMIEGGAFVHGELDQVQEQLREYRDAGVDEIILNVTGVFGAAGHKAAMDELTTLVSALAPARAAS